ncbi:MAG: MFS transporter [Chloroflexi bacterium]|nr:MFS transporter [Chloroflexota bacterium]
MTSPVTPAEVDTATGRGAGFGPVLRNRNFMLIWSAQGLSQIAYHAVNFALIVLVETLTRSSLAVGLIILAFSLPAILFSGIAGVMVDRSSRRQVMVVTTLLRTLVLALLLFIRPGWPASATLALLYAVTFLFSTLSQTFGPAEGALIPNLVAKHQLIAANSLFNLTFFASQLIGFAVVGPVLAKVAGTQTLFEVATALYAVCTVLVWLLPRDEPPPTVTPMTASRLVGTVWHELVEGVRLVWADSLLVKAIGYLSLASSAFLMLGTIGPAFVTRVLGIQAEDVALIMAPAGIGIVIGILLVSRLATATNREKMIDVAILAAGLATLLLAAAKPTADLLWVPGAAPLPVAVGAAMAAAALLGATSSFILVPSQTILQERSPDHVRARVYAAFYTVSSAASLLPVLFAGALSDLTGVTTVLIVVGVAFVGIGIVNFWLVRRRASAG